MTSTVFDLESIVILLLFTVQLNLFTVYYFCVQIYVIDSADRKRMEETGVVSIVRSLVAMRNSLVSIVKNRKIVYPQNN